MTTELELRQFMLEKAYKPLTLQELQEALSVPEEDTEAFHQMIAELEAEGKILQTKAKRFAMPERLQMIRGILQAHSKGFAFVLPDQPGVQDLYVHSEDIHGAMDGDTVLARVYKAKNSDRRPEGEVVRVVKRKRDSIVGTFQRHSDHFAFVVPDDPKLKFDIFVAPEHQQNAQVGQKVVVKFLHFPTARNSAEGQITEILGFSDEPGVDILSIIRKHGLPEAFPAEVVSEADEVPDKISEEEIRERRDLRDRVMVTIDGADAKDLDDAVSIEKLDNGNVRLGVHIADVSYYVREGSALDREAYERGCSVYLVDRVIPMLPKRLSNGICSLNPKVDRLTMTCDMEIDATGEVVDHEIYASVIRTNERMTYGDVTKILVEEDPELIKRYEPLVEHFRAMAKLAETLRKKRFRRGAIDFNFSESKILVDETGKPTDIVKRPRTVSEQLIEEFMLAANETVAEHFYRLEVPFVYRIHENPDAERLQSFFQFITTFGHSVKGKADKVRPRALQTLLDQVSGRPEEQVISTVLLRSMKQARYAAESLGHFGLAAEFYSHFTSPIRRYPDLLIHRVIREVLEKGTLSVERIEQLQAYLPEAAQHSSVRERLAIDAERETNDLKYAEYMSERIGEEFTGIISSVTNFGIFVELSNTIEGLIHVSYLNDDYYHYDESTYSLIGERTKRIFRIGDQVKIKVSNVNLEERKIDFELLEHTPTQQFEEYDHLRKKRRSKKAEEKTRRSKEKPRSPKGGKKGKSKGGVHLQSKAGKGASKSGKGSSAPPKRRRKRK
ncbi:ribonuclease R [Risungbinella massiliensis]|uniref:ribonuclease R n=1 Tax=Risungbinella massiliensis TaxID=1329796 RepID=UPI0005CB8070|nr:ribonuclease R [Risungbinella massiliensis]